MKKYNLSRPEPHRWGRWEYSLQRDGSICLHAYYGSRETLHIPSELLGHPVTAIGRCFTGPAGCALITLPSSVTRIGSSAFCYDDSLVAVSIPPETTFIAETAFDQSAQVRLYVADGSCAHLFAYEKGLRFTVDEEPFLPDSEQDRICGDWLYALTDQDSAVLREYLGSDTVVSVPHAVDGYPVEAIWKHCFHGNDFLEEVIIPEGIEHIGTFAFAQCPSLRRVHLPDSLVRLDGGCFCHCRDLREISLPPHIRFLQLMTFLDCPSLKEITLPEDMEEIDPMAFACCTSLEEIRLNPGLHSVADSAFSNCPRLRMPELPDQLDEASLAAFRHCTGR